VNDRRLVRWKTSSETWQRLKAAARDNRKAPTPAEALLWQLLRSDRARGFTFRRQHAIGPYIVDFYCAAASLVIEVDGPIHDQQQEEDAARTEFIEQLGLRVLRFTNKEVLEDAILTLETIHGALALGRSPSLQGGEGAGG
jgi:5-methyltetrahydrofolate--homocysteine methyltransferase